MMLTWCCIDSSCCPLNANCYNDQKTETMHNNFIHNYVHSKLQRYYFIGNKISIAFEGL